MNNKIIEKCKYLSKYKFKTGIIGVCSGILSLSIVILFFYYALFLQDTDINNKIVGILAFIVFILLILYLFYWSIKRIIISKKIENDINNNTKNKIIGKPYNVKISFTYPGIKNNHYIVSNIRLVYKLDNKLINLWMDNIFSTEKKIYKDTIINLLKNESFNISYLTTSKLITTPLQIEKIIKSYI